MHKPCIKGFSSILIVPDEAPVGIAVSIRRVWKVDHAEMHAHQWCLRFIADVLQVFENFGSPHIVS